MINTGTALGDEREQYDEMNSEEDEETVNKEEKPSDPEYFIPMKMPITSKPEISSNDMKESSTAAPKEQENENKKPQPPVQTQAPVQVPVIPSNVAGSKPLVPLQIPVAVASPLKPSNGNKKPIPNKENDDKPTSLNSGNNVGQRPQILLAPYGNSYYANQQTPNNGIHKPFINPFIQLGNYPIAPNFGYNPSGAQNNIPNVQPFAAPYFGAGQPQYVPPNFYNRPSTPQQNAPNVHKDKVEAQESSSDEEDDETSYEESESNSFEDSRQQNTQNIPPKKTEKVPVNAGASVNKVPPSYQAYFNYLNQFNSNPVNTPQVNPSHLNQQPNRLNPNLASNNGNLGQFNPNQFQQNHFNPSQYNPNQLNLQPNLNQYYPNNFNTPPNSNGFQPQYTTPNTQFNQYNPFNNPFNGVNSFLNQANFGNFPKPNQNPAPNRQIISKPSRKHQVSSEQKATANNQLYTRYKVRPNSDRKQTVASTKPEVKPQSTVNRKPDVFNKNDEKSEEYSEP